MDLPVMNSRPALALAEEHESERRRLYDLLPRFAPDAFEIGNVETEDNLKGILNHVTFAIFSYSAWIRRVLGRLDPAREKEQKAEFLSRVRQITTAPGFVEAADWAARHYCETLAEVTPDELGREFRTNWGETMTVEAMMEHALVHQMRHRRQLEIMLGLRPRGQVRAAPRPESTAPAQ